MVDDLRVIPLICPSCGEGMAANGSETVHLCARCRTGWELSGDGLVQRELLHLAGSGDVRLPFWLFPFQVVAGTAGAATLADYLSLTGSIQMPDPARAALPPLAFIPAFLTLPLPQLVRAGRLLTLRAPAMAVVKEALEPVETIAVSVIDAESMAEAVVLATIAEERRADARFLEGFALRLGRGRLFTIPFVTRGSSYWQTGLNLELL